MPESGKPGLIVFLKHLDLQVVEFDLLNKAVFVKTCLGVLLKLTDIGVQPQGAAKVKERCPEAVLIFLIPPSIEELSRRLHRRNTDAEDVIERRLEKARQECRESIHYDYLVVNDAVVSAAGEIMSILAAEQCRTSKCIYLTQSIVGNE